VRHASICCVFSFQLTLRSIEMYDQPVYILFSVTVTTVVHGNVNGLTACDMEETFLISNFRHVANVIFFLSDNSLGSEFYVPTFQNTLFHLQWSCDHDL
jgi:hypothetical protein